MYLDIKSFENETFDTLIEPFLSLEQEIVNFTDTIKTVFNQIQIFFYDSISNSEIINSVSRSEE